MTTQHLVVFKTRPKSVTERMQVNAKRGIEFLKVLTDTVLTQKGEWASPEVIEHRVATCQACPLFRPEQNKCGVCGCAVRNLDKGFKTNLMNKVAHKASACPKRKWHAVD